MPGRSGGGLEVCLPGGVIVRGQRHGKDPLAYMRDVLTRLPKMTNQDNLDALTPANWQPAYARSHAARLEWIANAKSM